MYPRVVKDRLPSQAKARPVPVSSHEAMPTETALLGPAAPWHIPVSLYQELPPTKQAKTMQPGPASHVLSVANGPLQPSQSPHGTVLGGEDTELNRLRRDIENCSKTLSVAVRQLVMLQARFEEFSKPGRKNGD